MPNVPRVLDFEELGKELFAHGLSNGVVDKVILALKHLGNLASWYYKSGKAVGRPTEHEVVAHMIVPLLLALGWSEQLLAIEWKRTDLATFDRTPTNDSSCVMICEEKVRRRHFRM